jgi:hypothetical protein
VTMADEKGNEEPEKGFVVKDRRFSSKKEGTESSQPKEEKKEEPPKEESGEQGVPLPEIAFTSLVFSLSTSALIQLGEIQDPVSKQSAKNLPLAKQTIDLIRMLQEKTKGNLSSDEEKLMEYVLYDLKMRYVKAVS